MASEQQKAEKVVERDWNSTNLEKESKELRVCAKAGKIEHCYLGRIKSAATLFSI
jgi:hypothetical protein